MKKFGFTLAEVLITLGIIGVVASLTTPALVNSGKKEANAAKLSVVVTTLENALSTAIIQENVENLYATTLWRSGVVNFENAGRIPDFVGNLGRYMVISGFRNSDTLYYNGQSIHPMTNAGAVNRSISIDTFPGNSQCFAVEMKNGAVAFIRTYVNEVTDDDRNDAIEAGSSYYTNAADIFIDVNGRSVPNTYGIDIFAFQVGENGILYPYGGRDVARLDSDTVWTSNGRFACTDAFKGSNDAQKGLGCTARLIDEGYKMNY